MKKGFPATVDESVIRLMEELDADVIQEIKLMAKKELISLHFNLGMHIRNNFGLWKNNTRLLENCGVTHPDDASHIIILALWRKLK